MDSSPSGEFHRAASKSANPMLSPTQCTVKGGGGDSHGKNAGSCGSADELHDERDDNMLASWIRSRKSTRLVPRPFPDDGALTVRRMRLIP